MRSHEIGTCSRAALSSSRPRNLSASHSRARPATNEDMAATRDLVIATVAHDLRNPISVVYAVLDFVLENMLPEDDIHGPVRRQLSIARRATDQMLVLVADLLDGATMDASQLALRLRPCDPCELVQTIVDELTALAAERGITLSCDVARNLPEMYADCSRIARVFANLGANAIRFTPRGGSIRFTATLAADVICFTVTDTGSGIAPQDLPYVFDRFWRAAPAESGGTGLGLAIAKWIVEAHRGRIWVESTPGAGTTFSFTVPASADGRRPRRVDGNDVQSALSPSHSL